MKITTLLLSASTVAVAAFFAELFLNQDGLIAGGLFVVLLTALIAMRDYTPRTYFSVTARRANPQPARGVSSRRAGLLDNESGAFAG